MIGPHFFLKGIPMKSVTEFPTFKLMQGLKTKGELTAAGKTPEEVLQGLGETYKLEGDKLKHFNNAVDVASQNQEKLSRVLVVSLAEGESIPPKAAKVEEHYYVPEFQKEARPVMSKADLKTKDAGRGKGKGGGKPKESPWGISPEEKAAKKAAAVRTQQAAAGKPS
jgi:hypothetical protein